jgi:hypothetical protein
LAGFFAPDAVPGDIREIVLESGNKTAKTRIRIVRQNSEWVLPELFNARADAVRVERLIAAVKDLKGEFRAGGPELLSEFGLDDQNATRSLRMTGRSGQEVADLLLGAQTRQGLFVRAAQSDEVYLVPPDILRQSGLSADSLDASQWMEHTFTLVDEDEVRQIALTTPYGRDVFSLSSENGQAENNATVESRKRWTADSDAWPPDQVQSVVSALVSVLDGLHVDGVADPARRRELGLDNPEYMVRIETADGEHNVRGCVHHEDGERTYRIEIQDDPRIYRVNENLFNRLFPTRPGAKEKGKK